MIFSKHFSKEIEGRIKCIWQSITGTLVNSAGLRYDAPCNVMGNFDCGIGVGLLAKSVDVYNNINVKISIKFTSGI